MSKEKVLNLKKELIKEIGKPIFNQVYKRATRVGGWGVYGVRRKILDLSKRVVEIIK